MNINDYLNNIFDTDNSNIKLDAEQKAVVLDEHKNCLVLAGAGSGKTTVISAKVKYLIDIKKVNPNHILVISFTNESVNDLKKQIIQNLKLPVSIKTFHKLALQIIGENKKFKVCDNLYNVLDIYFSRDIYFSKNYLDFLKYLYTFIYKQNGDFYKIYNNTKIKVMSLEEIAISNFLMLANLNFKYKIINFKGIISKFIIKYNSITIVINYIEKEKTLFKYKKQNSFNITKNKDVIKQLRLILLKFNIINFNASIDKNNEYFKFLNTCYSFINNYKVKYSSKEYFSKLSKKYINTYQIVLFINIISRAYEYYMHNNLKNNIIDFNDIINEAIIYLKSNKFTKYKYVLIDEFQDISKNRLEIIKYLSKNNANIIAFGDDWQAIFGFAGSDVNLFIKFPKIIKNCNILKISKTYRNSQQLIDIVGKFIMTNKFQLKKQLSSDKRLFDPIVLYLYNEKSCLSKIIYEMLINIISVNPNSNILILGRYKFSINKIIDKNYFDIQNDKIVCLKTRANITFLTVHASKGLTFDEVIILDVNEDVYGFPSQIVDNYELSILKEKENYYLEEERRLFYVALTRTRNHNYLLSNIEKVSPFVLELIINCNIMIKNNTKEKLINHKYFCKNCGYFFYKHEGKKHICPRCNNKILIN